MDSMEIPRVEHLPARVAAQISHRIQQGSLKSGDRLPTEHAMSKSFGVSRTVIREAIAQLRSEGLVETRQGIGAFVTDLPQRHIRLEDGGSMDRHAFRDLYQLRLPLEIESAGLAAVHRSPEHLAQLTEAIARMDHASDQVAESVAADLEFHRIIAAATGNDYFVQFVGAISDRIGHVILEARAQHPADHIHAVTLDEHGPILRAIAARDPQNARATMRAHLLGSAERIGLALEVLG
ncbi:MAG: FadR/GntR family transcriptional regulator [Paracoccus sp. (in: a-proteobacteria)]|nr:FadR/GntR family transcriptional regulator [Paracoccus sp. (in: a-proteobacteria)]